MEFKDHDDSSLSVPECFQKGERSSTKQCNRNVCRLLDLQLCENVCCSFWLCPWIRNTQQSDLFDSGPRVCVDFERDVFFEMRNMRLCEVVSHSVFAIHCGYFNRKSLFAQDRSVPTRTKHGVWINDRQSRELFHTPNEMIWRVLQTRFGK